MRVTGAFDAEGTERLWSYDSVDSPTAPSQRPTPPRFVIHDRDSKFSRSVDAIFRSENLEIIRTLVRAPQANAIAERSVRTARAESLDWLLILGRRHLEQVLRVFVAHYTTATGRTPSDW